VKIFELFYRSCFELEDIKNYTKIDFESKNKLFRSIDLLILIKTYFMHFLCFHIRTVHLDITKVIYSPTNAQVIVLHNNIKIYIKTAPTCFGAVTPSSGSSLSVLTIIDYFNKV
jgi:hypothetical protein